MKSALYKPLLLIRVWTPLCRVWILALPRCFQDFRFQCGGSCVDATLTLLPAPGCLGDALCAALVFFRLWASWGPQRLPAPGCATLLPSLVSLSVLLARQRKVVLIPEGFFFSRYSLSAVHSLAVCCLPLYICFYRVLQR